MTSPQIRVKAARVYLVIFAPIFFVWSYVLLTYYTGGDQIDYLRFYNALKGASIDEVMGLAMFHVTSIEPISAFILWIGANLGVEKNIYISILNLFLAIGVFILLRRHKSPWYIFILIFSNFYFIVLMTGAERLKIAYIILVYASLLSNKYAYVLAFTSPLAHLQSFIFLVSISLAKFSQPLKSLLVNFRIKRNHFLSISAALVIMLGVFFLLQDGIVLKGTVYIQRSGGLNEIANILLLLVIALLIAKDRFKVMITLLPLIGAVYLLGGSRVNMIAVTVFFYLILKEGRLTHPLSIILLIYFSAKSILFVKNIFVYGHGFAGFLI